MVARRGFNFRSVYDNSSDVAGYRLSMRFGLRHTSIELHHHEREFDRIEQMAVNGESLSSPSFQLFIMIQRFAILLIAHSLARV